MKRFLSNRLYFQTRLLSNTVVEFNDQGILTRLIPMSECQVEPAHTIFIPGTLTGAPTPHTTNNPHNIPAQTIDYNTHISTLHVWNAPKLTPIHT